MTCANPIAWATLVDYWAGDLNDAETAVVDEHLFGCDELHDRLGPRRGGGAGAAFGDPDGDVAVGGGTTARARRANPRERLRAR